MRQRVDGYRRLRPSWLPRAPDPDAAVQARCAREARGPLSSAAPWRSHRQRRAGPPVRRPRTFSNARGLKRRRGRRRGLERARSHACTRRPPGPTARAATRCWREASRRPSWRVPAVPVRGIVRRPPPTHPWQPEPRLTGTAPPLPIDPSDQGTRTMAASVRRECRRTQALRSARDPRRSWAPSRLLAHSPRIPSACP